MDFQEFITWGFNALLAGMMGIVWFEIRKLRESKDATLIRLANLERHIAEKYITRIEVETKLANQLADVKLDIRTMAIKMDRLIDDRQSHRDRNG